MQCLENRVPRRHLEIAEQPPAPLATVRGRIAERRATGAVVTCKLTRYEGDRTIEAWQCRVSGVCAGAGGGTEGEVADSQARGRGPVGGRAGSR